MASRQSHALMLGLRRYQALVAAQGRNCVGDHAASMGLLSAARSRRYSGIVMPAPGKLDDIVKLDRLRDKSAEEVVHIWTEYYEQDSSKGSVSAVLSTQEYDLLSSRAKQSPNFVIPLGKPNGGFVTLVMQCQLPHILLTTLEEYKKLTVNAPPHLTLTHYQELSGTKGLVLVRGDIITDTVIGPQESKALMQLVRAFYCNDEDYQDLYNFNNDQSKFSFDALLAKLRLRAASQ